MFDLSFWLAAFQAGGLTLAVTVGVWAVVYLYRVIFKQAKPPEAALQIAVAVASLAVAWFQVMPQLPAYAGDPVAYLSQFLTIAGMIFAAAQIVYDKVWALALAALDKILGLTAKAHSLKGPSQA